MNNCLYLFRVRLRGFSFLAIRFTGCLMVSICLLMIGCSPESGERGEVSTPGVTAEYEDQLLSGIKQTESVFRLIEMKQEYRRRGGRSREILTAFKDKQSELLRGIKTIQPVSGEIDLITSEYRKIRGNKYRLSLLFRPKKELDRNCRIYIHGYVDQADRNLLPASRRQYGFENWTFEPLPPTSVWDIGQDVIVSHDFSARPIPYDFKIGFYQTDKGGYGKEIDLGWREDTGLTDEELLEEIKQADNIIDLARFRRKFKRCSSISPTVHSSLEDKWRKLFDGVQPIGSIFGADLVEFQYRKVGADRYRVSYLFKVRNNIKEDYRIYLHGYVDDNHVQQLPVARREYRFANWSFAPNPPMTTWSKGEYVLITDEITACAIPYNMKTGFYLSGGRGGSEGLPLGWQADPGE